jgi:hypothetical protein
MAYTQLQASDLLHRPKKKMVVCWVRLTPIIRKATAGKAVALGTLVGCAHINESCKYLRSRRVAARSVVTQLELSDEQVAVLGVCRFCCGLTKSIISHEMRQKRWPQGSQGCLTHSGKHWRAVVYEDGKRRTIKASGDKAVVERALQEYRDGHAARVSPRAERPETV